MRPPTRTDAHLTVVPSLRKHPPATPATSATSATSISSPPPQPPRRLFEQPPMSGATLNDKGRRAFFNVESDQLLAQQQQQSTVYKVVPYERPPSNAGCDTDDFSTQVSFCSGGPPASDAPQSRRTTDDSSSSDDHISSSANNQHNRMLSTNRVAEGSADEPLWQPRRASIERRTNGGNHNSHNSSASSGGSSSSARSADAQLKRASDPAPDRVALVKNSASLIFTKKTAPTPHHQQLTVHRRQRDVGRVTENRRSLHEHQQSSGAATSAAATAARHERAYSWYAPLYTPLREEGGDYRLLQSSASPHHEPASNSPHVAHRLAVPHSPSEAESLLEPPQQRVTVGRASGAIPPNTLHLKHQNQPATNTNVRNTDLAAAGLKRHFSMSPHGADTAPAATAAALVAAPVTVVTPQPKYSRFEQLIKSLVGRKVSRDTSTNVVAAAPIAAGVTTAIDDVTLMSTTVTPTPMALNYTLPTPNYPSPEIRITKSPSEYSLLGGGGGMNSGLLTDHRTHMSSTASLNAAVQQRLWSVVPLLTRRETAGSCASLSQSTTANVGAIGGGVQRAALMKKCETVLALSRSSSSRHILEPAVVAASATATAAVVRPLNRLRHSSSSTITCSRCSSLLSLAANGSRYSLNVSQGGGFVAIGGDSGGCDVGDGSSVLSTPTPAAGCSRDSLLAAAGPMSTTTAAAVAAVPMASCKLCLGDVPANKLTVIAHCGCVFCTECMMAYVEFEILEGAYEISCPDALCPVQGALSIVEIARLSSISLLDKHKRYRLNREVDLDKSRTWCPKAGCDTVCRVTSSGTDRATPADGAVVSLQPISSSSLISGALMGNSGGVGGGGGGPCLVHCPTCTEQFCSGCKKTWHPSMSCEENTRRLAADGQADNIGIPFDNDLIKCCPTCSVPIEKDEGCAQMMCKRCKHVFCWYCLASLDDDFLLRHYDRGPCKNKLGHSRASVVWHRAQVIGIFAGFGILLLVASPLLLLAAPCIVCCKCRICSGAAKLEESGADAEFEEFSALNR